MRQVAMTLTALMVFFAQTAWGERVTSTEGQTTGQTAAGRKKVALVLSGGGAKGTAHVGALKVLERAGIPIDIITGTSMGSIVGGIYACGHSADELDSILMAQNWSFVLSDREDLRRQSLHEREKQNTYVISKSLTFGKSKKAKPDGGGLVVGKNIATLFDALTAPYHDSIDFNKLPIPFACVATNMVDNTEVVFHSGVLSRAMRASMSIPGVFAPVRTGGMVLVDGGLRNNYPADIARQMGADIIIGIDVSSELKTASELNSTSSILMQIVDFNCMNKFEENKAMTDILIRVNTKGYSSASFSTVAIDTLIRRGEEAAMEHWDELVALRQQLGVDGHRRHQRLLQVQQSLPATTRSKNDQEHSETRVSFLARDRRNSQVNVGARFDNEEMVALQANAEFPIRSKVPMDVELTLRLGKRLMARADWSMRPISFFRPTISYIFRSNEIDFYDDGDKAFSMDYRQHSVKVKLFNFNVRNLNISIGANWDYYHYHSMLFDHQEEHTKDAELKNKGYISYEAKAWYNSENDWYFPTSGHRLQAKFAYYTDNFAMLDGHVGIREYSLIGRMNFPLSKRFSIQPKIFGRALYADNVPMVLSNVMGGEWYGHYLDEQMPFAGVGNVELTWDKLVAAQMQAQYKVTNNNIILLRFAAGQDAQTFEDLLKHKTMLGGSLSYYFNSIFGPLGGSVGYNNLTKNFYYYINLGFVF